MAAAALDENVVDAIRGLLRGLVFPERCDTQYRNPPVVFPHSPAQLTTNITLAPDMKSQRNFDCDSATRRSNDFHGRTPIFVDTGVRRSVARFVWNFQAYVPHNARTLYEKLKQHLQEDDLRRFVILALENEMRFVGFGAPGTGGQTLREVILTVHTIAYCVPKAHGAQLCDLDEISFAFPGTSADAKRNPVREGAYQPVVVPYDRSRIIRNKKIYDQICDMIKTNEARPGNYVQEMCDDPLVFALGHAREVMTVAMPGAVGGLGVNFPLHFGGVNRALNVTVDALTATFQLRNAAGAVLYQTAVAYDPAVGAGGNQEANYVSVVSALYQIGNHIRRRAQHTPFRTAADIISKFHDDHKAIKCADGIVRPSSQDDQWPLVDCL